MKSRELTLTILGSGTSTGVPVPGCGCPVCSSADPFNQRTRCSALLSWQGRNILIDTATDLRQQTLREGLRRIDAVLYTHTHADHVHGIDDLRTFSRPDRPPLPVFAGPESLAVLQRVFAYIFSEPANPGTGRTWPPGPSAAASASSACRSFPSSWNTAPGNPSATGSVRSPTSLTAAPSRRRRNGNCRGWSCW